ncbi:hypothetical protein M2H08_04730 [Vibrio vulnificus]|uniref:hypothetical protein n=2 Tax=Vibrionaceae TaxID=641 RepID=UPI001029EC90|nr:hypothetical protein [Vibrio vulnificus]EGQ7999859.1 hypothetical protein [Vibrio vulnificus]MCU8151839.1 hypothetical protein [Vibrio vulnificus]RZP94571.1 hypothetical protein D8T56_03990 [Vibrio vulnificus]RZP97558.1 hypothetical protein D8T54_08685 [Vibrio vulnificus]
MKRFLPSSVMLTPFVVRHYQEEESEHQEQETSLQHSDEPRQESEHESRKVDIEYPHRIGIALFLSQAKLVKLSKRNSVKRKVTNEKSSGDTQWLWCV